MTMVPRRVSTSPLARLAALPVRAARVGRHDAAVVGASMRWLVTSREHHNYTYDLTARSWCYLAWYVAAVAGIQVHLAQQYLDEVTGDAALQAHVHAATMTATRRGLADAQVRLGRRAGWYALVRALRPAHVVESGVDKGLGTVTLAAALLRNAGQGAPGRLTAIDINPYAGYLAQSGPYATVTDLVCADTLRAMGSLDRPVDLFLHDSDHRAEHEALEYASVEPHLSRQALLLSDNAAKTDVLARYARQTGRRFLYYREEPLRHWYPGDGIGAAWRPPAA
jgi:predicted O-methyltransferase YrrM